MISLKRIILFTITVTIICVIISDVVEGRGARGGSFRGGYRGGYRGSRSRSTRSRSYRSRSSYRSGIRTRSRSFNWKHAVAIGAVYGYSTYSIRRHYYSHSRDSNWRPRICTNYYDYKMDNGTSYTMFVCPQYGQSDDHVYCCGPEDRQKCCTWWDNGGNVAGVVIGILAFLGISGGVAFCCYRSYKKKSDAHKQEMDNFKSQPVSYAAAPQQIPPAELLKALLRYYVSPSYPQGGSTPYPVNPENPEKSAPYPPENGSAPYPPADGAPPYPPQPMGDAPPYSTQPYPAQPYPPAGGDTSYPATAPPPYPAQ